MGMMGQLDPTKFHTYFDDFDTYHAADWSLAGAGTPTVSLVDGVGGLLQKNTSAGISDQNLTELLEPSIAVTLGKKAFYKVKLKLSTINALIDIGIRQLNSDIRFQSLAADGLVRFRLKNVGDTLDSGFFGQIVDDTYFTLSWAYDGRDTIAYYFDEEHVGTAESSRIPTVPLKVRMQVVNTIAQAEAMTIDYVFIATER